MQKSRKIKKNKNKIIAVFMLTVLLCAALALPASANSAPSFWEGTDTVGAVVSEGDCPLVVEHEVLTFDIDAFPESYYAEMSDFLAYDASVTAEYRFYNPTDMTVTAKLLFPYGQTPVYGDYFYGDDGEPDSPDLSGKYGAQINGEDVQTTVRYTWGYRYQMDDALECVDRIYDTYYEEGFLTRELPVHVYTYTVDGVPVGNNAATVGAYFDHDAQRTMVLMENSNGGSVHGEGVKLGRFVHNDRQVVLYVFGEDIGEVEWKLYANGGMQTEIDGNVTLTSRETVTFEQLAMQKYDAASGVPLHDWFNAIVACLEDSAWDENGIYSYGINDWDISSELLECYEYELTLAPGERLTNTVTAPLYPTIDGDYDPAVYGYTYLLSPATRWADFGTLDIYIHTPYYMVDIKPTGVAFDAFAQTDTGYAAHLAGLPEEELRFVLSTDPEPVRNVGAWVVLLILAVLAYVLFIFGIVVAIIGILGFFLLFILGTVMIWLIVLICMIVLIVLGRRKPGKKKESDRFRKRKKNKENTENRKE